MTRAQNEVRDPLRLWPGVVIVVVQWLVSFVVPWVAPSAGAIGAVAGLLGGVAMMVWWGFFSRAPRSERWGGLLLLIVALVATTRVLHVSLATGGMGVLFYVYAVPPLTLAFVVWAALSRRLSSGLRWATMVAVVVLACGGWTLLRTGGVFGSSGSEFAWRWAPTAEERLLAADVGRLQTASSGIPTEGASDWPGFRGRERNGVIAGVRIETDWSESPPVELWRRAVGPGWSSFAVHGDRIYTQEQRGEEEVVSCYAAATGEPVWRHSDPVRFWESNAGAGPRGTPTLSEGRVYTFGATGLLNVLDAGSGARLWMRDVAADTAAEIPMWGFSSSPLVVDDVVIAAPEGQLVAYDITSGELRWSGPAEGAGYSSPHLVTIDGVTQVLLLSGAGGTSFSPGDGTVLWHHAWLGFPIVQPAVIAGGDLLMAASQGSGTRRVAVEHDASGWSARELWTSNRLKPYFSDFVVHKGYAYGFDGAILASIDLENGERAWKGGRYGHGQLILLPEQDLLLVISEQGELALVSATPDGFAELARFPAIEGKTWNHPVLVGDLLLVRNSQEMAAFRLASSRG